VSVIRGEEEVEELEDVEQAEEPEPAAAEAVRRVVPGFVRVFESPG